MHARQRPFDAEGDADVPPEEHAVITPLQLGGKPALQRQRTVSEPVAELIHERLNDDDRRCGDSPEHRKKHEKQKNGKSFQNRLPRFQFNSGAMEYNNSRRETVNQAGKKKMMRFSNVYSCFIISCFSRR